MKILIETCLNHLYLLLFNDDKIIDKFLLINFKKKSDKLPLAFNDLLIKNNLDINNIKAFYVTQGPGSFMGVRAGLLFAKTLATILNKKIYICNTFNFLQTDKYKDIYIKTGAKTFYALINKKTQLIEGNFISTTPDYNFIENNLLQVLKRFKETDYFTFDTFYMKKPNIGKII